MKPRMFALAAWMTVAFGAMIFALINWASPAVSDNCPGYPFILTNGTTADANQVMADFNSILGCANANLAHNGVNSDLTQILNVTNLAKSGANSDITSLTGITTPILLTEGGTGSATASGARTNLGLGTAAVENLLGNIIDSGGNLIVGNSGVTAGSYTNTNLTVSAAGLITAASNGTAAPLAATATQMEAGSSTTVFANPANVKYSDAGIKAFVAWNYTGGTLHTFFATNATISRIGAGQFTLTVTGGYTFANGTAVCSAHNGGNAIFASPAGGIVANAIQIDTNNAGGAQDPGDYASCIVFGNTTN